jgi:serpin B
MHTSRKIASSGKRRFQPTGRPGRATLGYRRLGIEQLEDRRVLSGLSPLAVVPPVAVGPIQPSVTAASTAGSQSGTTLSPAQLAAETTVGQSINAFAESLYGQLQGQAGGSGNLFLSPLSISTALAMTYAGAQGETATQMAAALHYTLDPGTLAADFGSLIADLNTAGQGNYSLSVADALWGQQGYSFLAPFLNLMQADYGGGLHQVDFIDAAETARQTINNWVAQETNNKIQNLIPPGGLNSLTRLVLTNAIYFKGQWATPFNANLTQSAAFTLGSGDQVQVPTMHDTDSYRYMQSDGYQVLELPYQGNRLVMDVLLPTGSGPSGLDVSQLPADLNGWLQGLTPQEVDVSLPKFQITTPSFYLNQPLEALGMTDAFNPNAADFSGISTKPLYISAVIHKAFIDVDENGTAAAAATAIIMEPSCIAKPITPAVVFNADQPFLFLIRDAQSGSVLFMGQVADPSTTGEDPTAPAVPKAQTVASPTSPPMVNPPSAVQLTASAAGLTNLNNSSPAKSPRFNVSGLTAPPAGDTAQVILYADGTQIGEAIVTASPVVVTANGKTTLTDGTHQIAAVEEITYPASQGEPGETVSSFPSKAETISVSTVVPQISSTPVTQAVAGSMMNYQVTTKTAASEEFAYRLVTAPAGMTISSSGKISWDPPAGTSWPQRVDVRVTDQYGNFSDHIFSIGLYNPFARTSAVDAVLADSSVDWWL